MRKRIPAEARILIIDDEVMAADVLCRILEADGFRHVERITDPREAVARFEQFEPHLVILDWMMPGLSGLEVLRQLRADIPHETYLPILVVTALPHPEVKHEALTNGATDFLTKPYDRSEIVLRVSNLLETRFLHLELEGQNRLLEQRVEERTAELRAANAALEQESGERARVQRAVERITEEWMQSFDAIPDHVCILNLQGKIVRANRTMRERFEPLHGALDGVDYRLCYCGSATPATQPPCAEVLVKNRPVVWEGKVPALNGWFWIASYPLSENGVQWGAVSVVRDMTAPKEAEEALRSAQEELEERVRARTEALAQANRELAGEMEQRQKAEKLVQQERDELRDFFDNAAVGLHWVGEDGTILSANPAELDLLGYAAEEYIGHSITEFHADQEVIGDILTRLVNKQMLRNYEASLRCKDGSIKQVLISSNVLWRDGKFVHTRCFTRDITARKKAEEAVRFQAHLLENVSEAVIATDPHGIILYANRFAESLYGWPAQEMVGRGIVELIVPQPSREQADPIMKALSEGKTWSGEFPVRRRDGTSFLAHVTDSALLDPNGNVVAIIGISQDVTKRKEAEEALRLSEEKLSLAVTGADLGTWDWNVHSDQIRCSARTEEMFGLAPGTGRTLDAFLEAVHPEDRGLIAEGLQRSIETHTPYEVDYRVVHSDGSIRWIAARGGVRANGDGQVTDMSGTVHDVTERERMKERLRETEARYHRVAANAPGMIYQFVQRADDSMEFLYVSEGSRELFGIEPAAIEADANVLVGRIHPEDLASFARSVEESRSSLRDWQWEGRFVRAPGDDIWISGASRPVRQPNGDVAWDGLLTDITARKKIEEQLRDSARENTQLASAIANLTSGVVITDPNLPDNPIIFANPAFCALTGYSSEEVIGRNCRFLQGPESDAATMQEVREAIAARRTFHGDVLNYRKDGSTFWNELTITPVFDRAGDLLNFVGLQSDITERKQAVAQNVLRTAQQAAVAALGQRALRPTNLLSLFNEAVALVAKTLGTEYAKILELQPNGQALLVRAGVGWKEGHIGRSSVGAGSDSQAGFTLASTEPVIAEDLRTETRFKSPPLWHEHGVISAMTVIIGGLDQPFGVLGACSQHKRSFSADDVHFLQAIANMLAAVIERTSAETKLLEAKVEAERANAAKSEFLSRMSHELRTPLNAILGFSQLAGLDAQTADDRENVEQIQSAGAHLLQLVNEILDLSSIEAGRVALTLEPVSLHVALSSAYALVRPMAAQRKIELTDYLCPLYVLADEKRLHQVLINLFSNAIKYNRESGTVIVTCERTAHGTVRIDVKDSGIGIESFNLEMLFQPFQRFHPQTEKIEGIGLGLAISRRLIESMGGSITAVSERDLGSTFSIELPIADRIAHEVAESAAPAAPSATAPGTDEQTLLYIEDNISNLKLIERIIARRPGIRMIAAQQGSIGLEMARQHQPDMILLDLHLPDMNGDQVLTWLRSDPRTAHIPVVLISANAIGGEITRLKELGACAYVTKPFEVTNLLQVIGETLARGDTASPAS